MADPSSHWPEDPILPWEDDGVSEDQDTLMQQADELYRVNLRLARLQPRRSPERAQALASARAWCERAHDHHHNRLFFRESQGRA